MKLYWLQTYNYASLLWEDTMDCYHSLSLARAGRDNLIEQGYKARIRNPDYTIAE